MDNEMDMEIAAASERRMPDLLKNTAFRQLFPDLPDQYVMVRDAVQIDERSVDDLLDGKSKNAAFPSDRRFLQGFIGNQPHRNLETSGHGQKQHRRQQEKDFIHEQSPY